jgi:mono/diheme cytochrome c family protein
VTQHAAIGIVLLGTAFVAACSDNGTSSMGGLPAPTDTTVVSPPPPKDVPPKPAQPVWTPPTAPPPASGPGSAISSAHDFYIKKVYPALANCAACHQAGNNGAPIFLQTDPAVSYQSIDARGWIQLPSPILQKGPHMGPALTTEQMSVVNEWLQMEAKERVGQAAPVNILDKIGNCLLPTLFDQIHFENLLTQARNGEDANQCTGCNQAQCNTCHLGGDGGFYMGVGSPIDNASLIGVSTFTATQKAKYIVKYIGLNGTQPVPSYAIKAKQALVAVSPPYAHPMFVLPPEMDAAINNFVGAAINAYNSKLCGQ